MKHSLINNFKNFQVVLVCVYGAELKKICEKSSQADRLPVSVGLRASQFIPLIYFHSRAANVSVRVSIP